MMKPNDASLAADEDSSPALDEEGTFYSMIGMALAIGAAIVSNLGVNIQKQSHINCILPNLSSISPAIALAYLAFPLSEDNRPEFRRRPYVRRPLWLLGMSLVVVASLGDFQALAFAPQALVAAVGGGMTVLANVVFAHCWLKQRILPSDILGTLFIVGGIVLSAFANIPDKDLKLHDLEQKFMRPGFVAYVLTLSVIIAATWLYVRRIESQEVSARSAAEARLVPYFYAMLAGLFGSFAVLLAKSSLSYCLLLYTEMIECVALMVFRTMMGNNQFSYPITYVFVLGTLLFLILQTDLLNRSLMSGDTLSVFPVFQCFWIGGGVLSGLIFYQKFAEFDVFQSIAFPVSSIRRSLSKLRALLRPSNQLFFFALTALCIVIMLGIYLLAKHKRGSDMDSVERQYTLRILPPSPVLDRWTTGGRRSASADETTPLKRDGSKRLQRLNSDRVYRKAQIT